MFDARQELAVLNNVYWYQAMFRAHGLECACDDLLWSSESSPPPFHSNLVVVSPVVDIQRIWERLAPLERSLGTAGFSLKDSFANLDLAAFGYRVLFGASWIWHAPLDGQPTGDNGHWAALTSPEALQAWEDAWRGDASNTQAGPVARQFPPSLLASPHHRFLARFDGRALVAGAIANRSPGAVGLSNAFRVNGPVFDDWQGLMQCASVHFPGVPLVGYEQGDALQVALAAGFERIGALRIWQRPPRSTFESPAAHG